MEVSYYCYLVTMEVSYYCLLGDNGGGHITVLSYYCLFGDNGGVVLLLTWWQWRCHITVYLVAMEVSYYCLLGDNKLIL